MKSYYLPTKIIIGRLNQEIREVVNSFKPQQVLLITDQGIIKNTEIVSKLLDCLLNYQISIFDKVESNPGLDVVAQAESKTDLIIGLGGGSVMDVAKVVATNLRKPCIVVPTTAGTGSEVTPFAALYDMDKKKKLSLDVNFPNVAIIDYELTLTLPSKVVAVTGMDALSQAIEAYWSIHSAPTADVHAKRAIELVIKNLKNSFDGKKDAKKAMSLAAMEAGLAFSQTKTTAVHSVSYPLTIHYGFAHGLACALTLPHFLIYNYQVLENDCLDKRGVEFVKKRIEEIAQFLGADSVKAGKEKILNLMEDINLPIKVDFDIEVVLKDAFYPERVKNNPRCVAEEDIRNILKSIKK